MLFRSRTVRYLVLEHLRPAGYDPRWTDSAVRRLITECGDNRFFEKLMLLSRADLTTKNPKKRERCGRRADELVARVERVIAADSAPKLPKGTMGIIIENGFVTVGPALGKVRADLERALLDGRLPPDKDANWYATEGFNAICGGQMPVTLTYLAT